MNVSALSLANSQRGNTRALEYSILWGQQRSDLLVRLAGMGHLQWGTMLSLRSRNVLYLMNTGLWVVPVLMIHQDAVPADCTGT